MMDGTIVTAAVDASSVSQASTWWKDSLFAKLADKVRRVFSELFSCFFSQPKWVMGPTITLGHSLEHPALESVYAEFGLEN